MRAHLRLVVASLLTTAIASACSGGAGTATAPPSSSGAPASGSPAAPSATASAGDPSATSAAPASPSTAFACPVVPVALAAPTNRLTDVVVTPRDGYDEVAFVFGPAGSGSGVVARATVESVSPPFTAGASGLPLVVDGDSFVALTLRDMVVADDGGSPTYAGPTVLRPSAGAVAEVVQAEAFEGVVRWIVGAHGTVCARVRAEDAGSRIILDLRRA